MKKFQNEQLKLREKAFIYSAYLTYYMDQYSSYMKEENQDALDYFAKFSTELPLPSGRWGNAIALALELHHYDVAEYLIEHADEFCLLTDSIVDELGVEKPWSLKDEYLYSQITYDPFIISKKDYETEEEYSRYLDSIERNKEANQRLAKKFSISRGDQKKLRYP